MRSAIAIFAVLLAGLGVWLSRAVHTGEVDATRPGVTAANQVLVLGPGREACQTPLDLDRPVAGLGLGLDDGGRPGPRLAVEVRDADSGGVLATATVSAGWALPLGQYFGMKLARPVPAGRTVEVCARNAGSTAARLVGKEQAIVTSGLAGRPADWAVFFPLAPGARRSYLAMTPDIARRASVLRPGIVTPAVYWALAALLLVGGPFALWRAVSSAD
jgi:hypothetical protein